MVVIFTLLLPHLLEDVIFKMQYKCRDRFSGKSEETQTYKHIQIMEI